MAAEISDFWPEFIAGIEKLDHVRSRYCNVLYMELFSEEVEGPTRVIFGRSLLRYVCFTSDNIFDSLMSTKVSCISCTFFR